MKSSFRAPALAVAILGTIATTHAQYSNPPSWMPMTMLNVNFDTNNLRLDVVDEAVKLGTNVYAVLAVATNGTYDPAKPWGASMEPHTAGAWAGMTPTGGTRTRPSTSPIC